MRRGLGQFGHGKGRCMSTGVFRNTENTFGRGDLGRVPTIHDTACLRENEGNKKRTLPRCFRDHSNTKARRRIYSLHVVERPWPAEVVPDLDAGASRRVI